MASPSNWVKAGDKTRYGKGEIYTFDNPTDAAKWAAKMDWEFNKEIGSGKISIVRLKKSGEWTIDTSDPISQAGAKGKWLKSIRGARKEDIDTSIPLTSDITKKLTALDPDLSEMFSNVPPKEGVGAPPKPPAEAPPSAPAGEPQVRGLARGVEEKAIENKLTNGFGGLPEYQTVNMKEQATLAQDLLAKDPVKAKNIAMGSELPPEGILPESVFVAVENKAIKEGDVETLKNLATSSGLVEEATTMGQRIRSLAERDETSPVNAISKVAESRRKVAERRNKGKDLKKLQRETVDDINKEIKKLSPKKEDWAAFIKSIQC